MDGNQPNSSVARPVHAALSAGPAFGSGEQGSAGIGSVVYVIHQAADGSTRRSCHELYLGSGSLSEQEVFCKQAGVNVSVPGPFSLLLNRCRFCR